MPMTEEAQIVESIEKFLKSPVQTDSPENRVMAERFSEICARTNARLEECAEYLKKDMRAEAVNLAESDPPIVELVKRLNFPALEDWLNFCTIYDWPEPPKLRMELLEQLSGAIGEQASLKPLEDEYRRKIHTGSLREKILILRKLKTIDPGNNNWENTLRGFEKIRIEELTNDAKAAIEKNDEDALKKIYSEMSSPAWLAKPEARVMAKIESTLKTYRISHLRSRANDILREISDAYSIFNVKLLNNAIARWDILCGDSEFQPADTDSRQVDEAREWVAGENKKITDKRNFNSLVKQIEKMLDDKAPFNLVENTYSKIRQYEMDFPEILQNRYEKYEQECELSRARAMKLKVVATLAAIILASVIVLMFLNHRNETRIRKDWQDQIGKAIEAKNIDSAIKILEKLKETRPKTYDKPEFLAFRKKVEEMQAEREQNSQRFKTLMQYLDNAAAEGFPEDKPVNEKIKEAESCAVSPEEIAELKRIKDLLLEHDSKKQIENKEKFLGIANDIDDISTKIQGLDKVADSAVFAKLLQEYENKLGLLLSHTGVPKDLYDIKSKVLKERLSILKQNYEQSLADQEAFRNSLKNLHSRLGSLQDFRKDLQDFIHKYPECPQAPAIEAILASMNSYETVPLIRNFNPLSLDGRQNIAEFKEIADKIPATSIWANEFPSYLKYYEKVASGNEVFSKFFKTLKDVPLINFYSTRFRLKDGGKVIEMISEQAPKVSKSSTINGKELLEYEILRIANVKDRSGTFWYIENKLDGWEVRTQGKTQYDKVELVNESDLEQKVRDFDNFKKLCTEISEASPFRMESLIPALVEDLRSSKSYPFKRLILLKNIFDQARKISWDGQTYEKLHKDTSEFIASFGEKYDYMNMKDEDKKKVLAFMEDQISLPQSKVDSFLVQRDITATALNRSVDFIGIARRSADGNVEIFNKKSNFEGEIWALAAGKDGKPCLKIVGSSKNGACLLDPALSKTLKDFEPLFAPMDGKVTGTLAESLQKAAQKMKSNLEWPSCWPAKEGE